MAEKGRLWDSLGWRIVELGMVEGCVNVDKGKAVCA